MATRLTLLVEDRSGAPGLLTEHGLSIWIERDGHRILFDTGTSGTALEANAAALGIRLDDAEAVCLSHGHYDHTGGLGRVLGRLAGADLYAHPAAFEPKLARRAASWQSIGISVSRDRLEAAGLHVHLEVGPQEVFDGAVLSGQVGRDPRFAPHPPHLFADGGAGPEIDPFLDDQALALRVDGGVVLVAGCAHAGIINHCRAAQRLMGDERLRAVVGGFHLVGASQELLDATLSCFAELDVRAIHPCHCTGDPAIGALVAAFPDRCHPITTGAVLDF